ncbi:U-box domain-containing protein 28-like [Pyrus ussuriensis x Pyrus communis]|uniref:U-box domain-containing protein 28-like n=1 Tax=Pyrus ussuriensis x Pyrus communis TaxID=2448454 RepID=A0A5N5FHJ7_9ROSA|nr:U-box domain-containing protein 28-like [Pyrus ussuriensis x Pyrus communis]
MDDFLYPFENQMVEEISLVDWNSPPIYDEYVDDDLSSSSVRSSVLPIARALENAEFILKFDYEALRFLSA